jgi:2-methylisocitrate lyase-like PEP mutase family enzyme
MKDGKHTMRGLFESQRTILAVGVYDAISAKIMDRAQVPSVYVTGYGAAASMLGVPDIGLVSMTEMVAHVRRISGAVECPVIADADTGYGGSANVYRTVREYEAAGANVIQLEDQMWPKRCGHMEGKRLVSVEEMASRVRVADHARASKATLILARTDAIAVEGFDASIERARTYAAAGADILFVEAPQDRKQMEAVPKLLDRPCMANMVEGGKTPFFNTHQLEDMGYRIALYPISALLLAAKKLTDLAAAFMREGGPQGLQDEMMDFGEFNDLIDLTAYLELDEL